MQRFLSLYLSSNGIFICWRKREDRGNARRYIDIECSLSFPGSSLSFPRYHLQMYARIDRLQLVLTFVKTVVKTFSVAVINRNSIFVIINMYNLLWSNNFFFDMHITSIYIIFSLSLKCILTYLRRLIFFRVVFIFEMTV